MNARAPHEHPGRDETATPEPADRRRSRASAARPRPRPGSHESIVATKASRSSLLRPSSARPTVKDRERRDDRTAAYAIPPDMTAPPRWPKWVSARAAQPGPGDEALRAPEHYPPPRRNPRTGRHSPSSPWSKSQNAGTSKLASKPASESGVVERVVVGSWATKRAGGSEPRGSARIPLRTSASSCSHCDPRDDPHEDDRQTGRRCPSPQVDRERLVLAATASRWSASGGKMIGRTVGLEERHVRGMSASGSPKDARAS